MTIKSCPFCGGHAYLEEGYDKVAPFARVAWSRVCCETCGATTKKYYRKETTPEEILEDDPHSVFIINLWNMRQEENSN